MKKGVRGRRGHSKRPLLFPEPELELAAAPELPVAQIPEAPTPDMPVWDIGGFALLEGRLVILGEDEVRRSKGREGNRTEAVAEG